MKRFLVFAFAACAAAVIVLALAPWRSGGDGNETLAIEPAPSMARNDADASSAGHEGTVRAPASRGPTAAPATMPRRDKLVLGFRDPAAREIAITGGARLVEGGRVAAQVELQEQRGCAVELAPARYLLIVEAGGFEPFEMPLVVDGPTELVCVLWPSRWIGVGVVLAGGTREDGAASRADFDALGSALEPDPNATAPVLPIGRFVPARDDPDPGRVGYVEYDDVRPAWIALRCRGEIVDGKALSPGDRELEFLVDPDRILGVTSSLMLRVVDERGVPLAGVEACLTADERSKWRDEHCEIKSPADGRLGFDELFAGSYLLALQRERASLHVQRIDVPQGAVVDLGDVVLPRLPLVRVLVVDSEGEPRAFASVEVGLADCPYAEDRAFARRNSFVAGEDGMAEVPRPTSAGVLRASTLVLGAYGGVPSYSRIEPIPPIADGREVVRLTVHERIRVEFEVAVPEGRLVIRDDRGRLHSETQVSATPFQVPLVPDAYSCEHFDAAGHSLARATFKVGGDGDPVVVLR